MISFAEAYLGIEKGLVTKKPRKRFPKIFLNNFLLLMLANRNPNFYIVWVWTNKFVFVGFTDFDFNCPHAARISFPLGFLTGEE